MNLEQVRQLEVPELADYVWRRLRLEGPLDPPLSDRFGPEPPEQFLIQAAEESDSPAFRTRLLAAVRDNLRRLVDLERESAEPIWLDAVSSDQVASIAYLVAEVRGTELLEAIYQVICSWMLSPGAARAELSAGQLHLLRTLALLQEGACLARFWEDLWQRGPRSLRGLVMFGWARAYPQDALEHLGELVETDGEIDLPSTLWSLVGAHGPGIFRLAEFARRLVPDQQRRIREALDQAGATEAQLRDFDYTAAAPEAGDGDFAFPGGTAPGNVEAARTRPVWGTTLPTAA